MSIPDPPSATARWFGPGELARHANTTIKALRVYEKAGLLTPDRREGGWRLYGPVHVARLHQILALKALGLSLKQIGETLDPCGLAIGQILDLQARQLAADIRGAQRRLKQVQRAREHLADHGAVPPDLLLDLARNLSPPRPITLAEIRAVIAASGSDQQVNGFVHSVLEGVADGHAVEARIGELLADADIVAAEGDPGSDSARGLADRWLALASTLNMPADDSEQAAAMRDVAARIGADPRLADTLKFLRAAVARRTAAKTKG